VALLTDSVGAFVHALERGIHLLQELRHRSVPLCSRQGVFQTLLSFFQLSSKERISDCGHVCFHVCSHILRVPGCDAVAYPFSCAEFSRISTRRFVSRLDSVPARCDSSQHPSVAGSALLSAELKLRDLRALVLPLRVSRSARNAQSTAMPMKRQSRATYEDARRIALALPHVEDGTWHGLQVLKVKGKLFVSLREELDSIAIRMPLDLREEMMTADPETYYVTDHYRSYPWMLVRLSKVRANALPELLQIAYRAAYKSKGRMT
jgi:hypothetical protein